jgi:hypothetical protein
MTRKCPDKKREYRRLDEARKKTYVSAYKLKQGCSECSYNKDSEALQLDHLPQYEKRADVSDLISKTWTVLLAEIDKCQVLCANCHAVQSKERRRLTKPTVDYKTDTSDMFVRLMTELHK